MIHAVVCTETVWGELPHEEVTAYDVAVLRAMYEHLSLTAKKQGVKIYFTNLSWYDYKKKVFSKGWHYEGAWQQVKEIVPHVIWDKTPLDPVFLPFKKHFDAQGMSINTLAFEKLASDKSITQALLSSFMADSVIITSQKEFLPALQKITTSKAVLKPFLGSGAKGVIIKSVKELSKEKITSPVLLESFIVSKKNLFPFPYGVFDLRLIFVENVLVDAYYRVSSPKVLTSNLSTGGKVVFLPLSRVPQKVLASARAIQEKIKSFHPNLYSLEFVIDENNRPWFLEINTKPGFMHFTPALAKRRLFFETKLITLFKRVGKRFK